LLVHTAVKADWHPSFTLCFFIFFFFFPKKKKVKKKKKKNEKKKEKRVGMIVGGGSKGTSRSRCIVHPQYTLAHCAPVTSLEGRPHCGVAQLFFFRTFQKKKKVSKKKVRKKRGNMDWRDPRCHRGLRHRTLEGRHYGSSHHFFFSQTFQKKNKEKRSPGPPSTIYPGTAFRLKQSWTPRRVPGTHTAPEPPHS